ncbi:MAG TPA: SGNH/GDSL hydrolase family protein [Acidimicrobiales bacterium]|nr:SGNH/GDSL hydrolase family protein [Acidimicrobiales bacterium]
MGKRLGSGLVVACAVLVGALCVPSAQAGLVLLPQKTVVYAALGDSYTSGPLVLPHDQSRVPQDCGQSYFNYPHVAAQEMHVAQLRDVSCGSATIDDFAGPQDGLPLGGTNAPQYGVLDASVNVVSVGIGGNDVNFTGLALDCVQFAGPATAPRCTPTADAGPNDPVTKKIAAMGVEFGVALDEIHHRAPNAIVLVVSYPTALPDNGVGCYPYLPIENADMPYLVAKFKEMNAELARQASLHNARYVDIYTPSIGHDACQPPGIAWVNGAVLVPPSFPAHPNQLGLMHSGHTVAAAMRAALSS